MRVLVVDDDDITLELICSMLKRHGYEADTASDGKEALEILQTRYTSHCRFRLGDAADERAGTLCRDPHR